MRSEKGFPYEKESHSHSQKVNGRKDDGIPFAFCHFIATQRSTAQNTKSKTNVNMNSSIDYGGRSLEISYIALEAFKLKTGMFVSKNLSTSSS